MNISTAIYIEIIQIFFVKFSKIQNEPKLGMALYYYFEIKNKVPLYLLYFHKNDFF